MITCRPPKLTDVGKYNISVTLNGKDFVPAINLSVDIYPDPEIVGYEGPTIINRKRPASSLDLVLVRLKDILCYFVVLHQITS